MSHPSSHAYVTCFVQQVRRERSVGQWSYVECLNVHVRAERAHLSEHFIDWQRTKLRSISALDAVEKAVGQQVRNVLQQRRPLSGQRRSRGERAIIRLVQY